jgi:SAM-dependent methyltransferase
MEFTGERFVPAVKGQIYYEHVHRYAIAARYCVGKRVLDAASGEGYGAALLAQGAAAVIGVDIDAESIAHARRSYYASNLRFLQGSVTSLPLPDMSVDVVTSFETIEHVGEHEQMLDEIRRVLAPGGVLVISSPNKLVYSDEPGFANPYHVKELYFSELRDLLTRRFENVVLYGQRLAVSSVVHPLAWQRSDEAVWFNGNSESVAQGLPTLTKPMYFIAVCSDVEQIDASSAYLDARSDILQDIWMENGTLRQQAIAATSAGAVAIEETNHAMLLAAEAPENEELEQLRATVARLETEAVEQRAAHDREVNRLQTAIEDVSDKLRSDHSEAAHALAEREREHAELARTHASLERLHAEFAAQTDAELERLRLDSLALGDVLNSTSWRVTKPTRLAAQQMRNLLRRP